MPPLKGILALILIAASIKQCFCTAQFDMFPGFDSLDKENTTLGPTTLLSLPSVAVTNAVSLRTRRINPRKEIKQATTTFKPLTTIPPKITTEVSLCREEEYPSNIGYYEVPTQRDLATQIKAKIIKQFNKYHTKTLSFLNDIQEATKATKEIAYKCPSQNRVTYKRCVKHVGNQCKVITKNIVTSLEYQRQDVASISKGSICNITSMKVDPVQLIKVLAAEEASLEFALPGFLRLVNACSFYCKISYTTDDVLKPIRHMTDQDLVVKHFLTKKNYVQLLKEPNN